MKRRRPVLVTLATIASVYAGLCLLVFLLQGKLLYYPGPPSGLTPADAGMEFEDLQLVTSDGVSIHAWYLPAEDAQGALLFCHGNAGTIADRLGAARGFLQMGLSVLLFDYRGYGHSEGSPSEAGTYEDGLAAWEYLNATRGFAPEKIAVYGESLGAGIAIEVARRRGAASVLTESAFTSVPDVGAAVYPWLPVKLLSRYRYDNESKVGELGVPLLVVHSRDDDLVPFAHAEALFGAAREPKGLLETTGGHNDGGFWQREEWVARVRAFLTGI